MRGLDISFLHNSTSAIYSFTYFHSVSTLAIIGPLQHDYTKSLCTAPQQHF
jgi:hypothetical protein